MSLSRSWEHCSSPLNEFLFDSGEGVKVGSLTTLHSAQFRKLFITYFALLYDLSLIRSASSQRKKQTKTSLLFKLVKQHRYIFSTHHFKRKPINPLKPTTRSRRKSSQYLPALGTWGLCLINILMRTEAYLIKHCFLGLRPGIAPPVS